MNESASCEISTDRQRLDVALIHQFLSTSYWARGIPRKVVEQCIENSLCFGAFVAGRQVGFARIVSDFASFAYLADVFVVEEHRGKGIGKQLIQAVVDHPRLQGLRRILLATKDAHGLYARFGFRPLTNPEHFMSVHRPDIYKQSGTKGF
ncbi:MAG TPA: GNAT family N-acetyltransferase [Verrucomicrobiae bacterium]|nr:GNAT family N-acetyltransferase [Verrucomicrobiae bacterium]